MARDDWISESIVNLAAGDQTEWTPGEWMDLLAELETSDMTISEFLVFYG